MKNCQLILLFAFLFLGVFSFETAGMTSMSMKKYPPVSSSGSQGFAPPTSIYGGHISGQTVEIDYSKCINETAKRI